VTRFLRTRWTGAGRDSGSLGFGRGGIAVNGGGLLAFSAACEPVRVALPSLLRDRRWPMYDRLPASRGSTGRVTLLGDAAHPMLQYLAQGACQAIEDAAALAQDLGRDLARGRPGDDPAGRGFRLRVPDDFSRIDWLYGDRVA
jgi:2-polyprenyl-6-methoxyphenol hydroxylase-like FAD-dependent oxidoreductase